MASAVVLDDDFYVTQIDDLGDFVAMVIKPCFDEGEPTTLAENIREYANSGSLFIRKVESIERGSIARLFTVYPSAGFIALVDGMNDSIQTFKELGLYDNQVV